MDDQQGTAFEEDERYKQCSKEMWLTVAFFFVNVLIAGGLAVAMGYGRPVEEVQLIFGLPVWYWYSGVVGSVILIVLALLMIKLSFKEMPLGAAEEDEQQ